MTLSTRTSRSATTTAGGAGGTTTATASTATRTRRDWRSLTRHYLEMVVAMFVGMTVLGLVVGAVIDVAGADGVRRALDGPLASAVVMCVYMVAGMAAWMAYRRHTLRQNVEMNAAMLAPMAVLVPLELSGSLAGHAMMMWLHVLMLGSMWLYVVWRPMEHCHG